MLTLVLLATLGAWVGFANPLLHFPPAALAFPLGLAWIGLRATSARRAFLFGWTTGLLACIGCFYWMVIPVQFYGGLPWYVALPCPALLGTYLAIYYGLFSLGMHLAGQRISGLPLCLLAGVTWSALEMLIGSLFTGFPWMNLASAFTAWSFAVQGASLVGAYGLSGVLAALATALLLATTYRSALFLAVVLAAAIGGGGWYRLGAMPGADPAYRVSIVQGNVDQAQKWVPAFQTGTVEKYATLTRQAVEAFHPHVVVWPETAMPFYLQDNSALRTALELLARDTGTDLILGSPAYRVTDLRKRAYVLLNRAWLMDETGRTTQSYDKEHLVPFGEYMPLKEYLPFDKLVQVAGNFAPGTESRPLIIKGVSLGMLICYEAIFPELAQQQVERGANVLINISNDAWFGDTSAPGQHLDLTALRAVEQGRWLVRSTNTGISAFIDPAGRVVARSDQFRAESLDGAVAPLSATTFFHRHFRTVGRAIYLLTIVGFAGILLGRGKRTKETSSHA